ncbi:MAG: type II toxin-antitoxin system HicA family toxin [bacterium]|nr:type II toxin-antitoxin system HicA family toxin [bacterium]
MKLPAVKPQNVIKALKRAGCRETHRKGSHRFFRSSVGKTTVVPFHKGKDLNKGLLHSILKDLDISDQEFIRLLRK